MRSFADDAYQLNNLEACGITRQAAYNMVKSCEEAGESVYKFLQIVDCSEVEPDIQVQDATLRLDAGSNKILNNLVDHLK